MQQRTVFTHIRDDRSATEGDRRRGKRLDNVLIRLETIVKTTLMILGVREYGKHRRAELFEQNSFLLLIIATGLVA